MKHKVKYSNLLLNTLLDTMRRENRRTIDGKDIMSFEKIIDKLAKTYNIPLEVEALTNGRKFKEEIDQYIMITERDNETSYTLLPWISYEELEDRIRNTIFTDMSYVYRKADEILLLNRTSNRVYKLRNIEREINENFLITTQNNITQLENAKKNELVKLAKIQKNLGISE